MNFCSLLMVVGLICQVKCEKSLVLPHKNIKRSARQGEIVFCDIGCVLYDPRHSPLIDDPGRNFYETFSVISPFYVIEVVGGNYDLSEETLRVMFSDRVFQRRHSRTSVRLKTPGGPLKTLVLEQVEVIQRVTFNLHTSVRISVDPGAPEEFTVKIPHVVPHVVFIHDFHVEHGGERVTGVVTVEAFNTPMTLEAVVDRLEDGGCWMKPLDRRSFQAYMVAVRVRGNDRHVVGRIPAVVQTHLEDSFPFDVYMDEINAFAFKFLEETLLQTKNVIRRNKKLLELCETISREPEQSTTVKPPDRVRNKPPLHLIVEYRSKNHTWKGKKKGKDTEPVDISSLPNRT